jgi:DNA-binding PadR family transcriptional regulator
VRRRDGQPDKEMRRFGLKAMVLKMIIEKLIHGYDIIKEF